MKHLFLSYNLSLIAKEKGFVEECFAHYNEYKRLKIDNLVFFGKGEILAPTYSQIIDWFREKHGLHIRLTRLIDRWHYKIQLLDNIGDPDKIQGYSGFEGNYTQGITKAIEEAFKLI